MNRILFVFAMVIAALAVPTPSDAQTSATFDLTVTTDPALNIDFDIQIDATTESFESNTFVSTSYPLDLGSLRILPEERPFGFQLADTACTSLTLDFDSVQPFTGIVLSNVVAVSSGPHEIICEMKYIEDSSPWSIWVNNSVVNDDGGQNGPSDFLAYANNDELTWVTYTDFTPIVIDEEGFVDLTVSDSLHYDLSSISCVQGVSEVTDMSEIAGGYRLTLLPANEAPPSLECELVHNDIPSEMTINADVDNREGDSYASSDFRFTVGGVAYESGETFSVVSGTTVTITMDGPDVYILGGMSCVAVNLDSGTESVTSFLIDDFNAGINLADIDVVVEVTCTATVQHAMADITTTTTVASTTTTSVSTTVASTTTTTADASTTTTTAASTTTTTTTDSTDSLPKTGSNTVLLLWFGLLLMAGSILGYRSQNGGIL